VDQLPLLQLPLVGLTGPPVPEEQSLQDQLALLQLALSGPLATLQLPEDQLAEL